MDSNTIDFERQYNNLDLGIFNSLKDPILHETLLNEFREAEPQPNTHLYVFDTHSRVFDTHSSVSDSHSSVSDSHSRVFESLDHREYTDELSSDESHTLRTKANELTEQFHSKLTKEKASKGNDLLDRRYYSPFIESTSTFKTLTKIIKLFEIYEKGYHLKDNTPETVVEEVIRHLTTLNNALSDKVASNLISHSENRYITIDAVLDNKPPNPDQLIKWDTFKTEFNSLLGKWLTDNKEVVQPIQSKENEPPPESKRLIVFNGPETIDKIHDALKGFFIDNEDNLLKALQGEALEAKLHFPDNQNKFVEVFKRLKYNGLLTSSPKDIREWLCTNFTYWNNRREAQAPFNASTVHDILTKEKSEPSRKERINIEWLPYKSVSLREREHSKEN